MDNSAVKQKCRMSLNLPREQSVSETIHVKSKRNSENVDAGFYNPYHGKKNSKIVFKKIDFFFFFFQK
jgi:hypothetical protein